jgi:hypothetical protein
MMRRVRVTISEEVFNCLRAEVAIRKGKPAPFPRKCKNGRIDQTIELPEEYCCWLEEVLQARRRAGENAKLSDVLEEAMRFYLGLDKRGAA